MWQKKVVGRMAIRDTLVAWHNNLEFSKMLDAPFWVFMIQRYHSLRRSMLQSQPELLLPQGPIVLSRSRFQHLRQMYLASIERVKEKQAQAKEHAANGVPGS